MWESGDRRKPLWSGSETRGFLLSWAICRKRATKGKTARSNFDLSILWVPQFDLLMLHQCWTLENWSTSALNSFVVPSFTNRCILLQWHAIFQIGLYICISMYDSAVIENKGSAIASIFNLSNTANLALPSKSALLLPCTARFWKAFKKCPETIFSNMKEDPWESRWFAFRLEARILKRENRELDVKI